MDKLSADQQAAIAKSSSDRLRQTLLRAGEEEATVSTIVRGALKEAAAKQRLQGPAEPSSLERELALRRLELEFELELKKMEKQQESERLKLELEKQKESEKLEHERMERESERKSAERERDRAIEMEMMMDKAKLELEHEFKMKQLEMGRPGEGDSEGAGEEEAGEKGERPVRVRAPKLEETLAGRTKRFGDTLWHVLPKMPTDVGQVP